MTANLIVAESRIAEIQTCTNVPLLTEWLGEATGITVTNVRIIAALVRRLEELGATIEIDVPIMPFIKRIAYGNMIPELFVAFQGNGRLLNKAGSLPKPEQEKFANDEPIKVMLPNGDHRMIPPSCLSRREVSQLFGPNGMRTESEQLAWLRDQDEKARLRNSHNDEPSIVLDRKRGCLVVCGVSIPASDLLRYTSQLLETSKKMKVHRETA